MTAVITREYSLPSACVREVLRYSGCAEVTPDMEILANECIAEAEKIFCAKVCYSEFPIKITQNGLDLGFASVSSRDLAKNLDGCDRAIVFCATVGHEIDRLIKKYGVISPAKAVIFQGLGAERIEALCDLFCADLKSEGLTARPRFSPGYGDLPLELQRDIFRTLDCPRRIGATLNQSLLISPTKSVSAVVGLKKAGLKG